ncbi:MAG: serine--tRNA ligase [Candidatus Berkelbacteria bacterium]|nr:serine--tRNA ligase [Candidatus Berkelbacteria bacterium]
MGKAGKGDEQNLEVIYIEAGDRGSLLFFYLFCFCNQSDIIKIEMLDINYLRENLKEVEKALAKKHTKFDLEKLLKLDDKRRDLRQRIEDLRALQNKLAKEGKSASRRTEKAVEIKNKIKKLEPDLASAETTYFDQAIKMHNIPDKSVPSKEQGNRIEKTWGKPPKFNFDIKSHEQLGKELDIIDIERGVKVSGTRFAYLKNEAVLLEFALVNYLIDKLSKKSFIPLMPPILVKEEAMFGTGFFPADRSEIYEVNPGEDSMYLIGTAEVPLAAYHTNEILDEKELPKKYWGFSTCLRREAGSYGQDTKGIIRVHQFDKIEMFVFSKPDESWKIFDELVKINEEIFQELELPFRLVNISGGELGAPNAKKIDTEVWIPSQAQYRELTSCSNDTDFQARRLNIKYKPQPSNLNPQTLYVHTLNDTALAVGRTIVAILENYQQKDGSVLIPKVLQKYTGFKKISKQGQKA